MDCPKCGTPGAKDVKLLISISYLCQNRDCSYFDSEHLYGDIPEALFNWEYQLEDGSYIMPDDAPNISWVED